MIANDNDLEITQQRIADFQRLLVHLRVQATPEEFPYVSSGYRMEVERMQVEVMEYLTRHVSMVAPANAA